MLGDLTGQKDITLQEIAAAIESLQAKGWDINPYTVADEAQIPRITLLRNTELMELVAKAKDNVNITADEALRRLGVLEERTRAAEERVAELEQENVVLLKAKQDAWQKGYDAGLHAGLAQLNGNFICDDLDKSQPDKEPCGQTPADTQTQVQVDDFTSELAPDAHQVVLEEYKEPWQLQEDDSQFDYAENPEGDVSIEEPYPDADEEFVLSQAAEEAYLSELSQTQVPADFTQTTCEFSAEELRDLLKQRFGRPPEPPPQPKEPEPAKSLAGSKFVGGRRTTQEQPRREVVVRNLPPNVRKACLVLRVRPDELTREVVHKAWKKEMCNPGTHPDIGGETEIAVYINTARDVLYRWLDAQAPKLGKKFGTTTKETSQMPDKPANEDLKPEDCL